ncbi:MAG TPA: hypothetical protein VGL87_14030 [Steroidobacteraceae bacterium]|jgi:hypothetical protein
MAHAYRGVASRLSAFAAVAGAAALAACAASNPPSSGKVPVQVTPRPMPPPGQDWHALVIVPFGTLLKDVPYRLSEVVVFHDAASAGAGHEDRDCYSVEGTAPPRLFGRPAGEYSLCFSSDRLNRIEASMSLPAESASAQFAAACAEWQSKGTPGASTPDRCEDRDGSTEIDARLTTSAASAEPAVSIVLVDAAPIRDAGP